MNDRAEYMKEYRAKKKVDGIVDNSLSRVRRHREKKRFQQYCFENLISCPPHVANEKELLEYTQAQHDQSKKAAQNKRKRASRKSLKVFGGA